MSKSADRALVDDIERVLAEPVYFRDVLTRFSHRSYRDILLAWSAVRSELQLARDESGRYWIERNGTPH